MSAVTDLKTWQWPPEVVTYAMKFNVADYLEPLRQATLRLFPTAQSLRIYLQDDPEIRDLTFLIFELRVPEADIPNWLEAYSRWEDEFYGLLPRPHQCPFVLHLRTARP